MSGKKFKFVYLPCDKCEVAAHGAALLPNALYYSLTFHLC